MDSREREPAVESTPAAETDEKIVGKIEPDVDSIRETEEAAPIEEQFTASSLAEAGPTDKTLLEARSEVTFPGGDRFRN